MKKLLALVLMLGVAGSAGAQSPLEAKTIELKHLKPEEAVSLLKPYLVNAMGTVTLVSANMPIVTIKDIPENLAKMEKVLAKYDHSPATIRLVFQLIEADTGPRMSSAANMRNPSSDLDATLRSVLRFSAYRVAGQGVASSGENSVVYQKLADADTTGWRYTYDVRAYVGAIRLTDETLQSPTAGQARPVSGGQLQVDTNATGSVHLNVELLKRTQVKDQPAFTLMETGLDVPLGHTVVLGTSTSTKTGVAIILTVKPELVRVK